MFSIWLYRSEPSIRQMTEWKQQWNIQTDDYQYKFFVDIYL